MSEKKEIEESVANQKYIALNKAINDVTPKEFWDGIDNKELEEKMKLALEFIFDQGTRFGSLMTMKVVTRELENNQPHNTQQNNHTMEG